MARPRVHLRNAPIVEALIDFRVLRAEGISGESFAGLRSSIGEQYTQASPMHSIEARFGIDRGRWISPEPVQSAVGWMYRANAAVAQFRVDGFTFSKVEPYTRWEEVFGEALRLWRCYVRAARPVQVSRVAVRYINRMRAPGPADLRVYLEAPPVLPPPIPQTIREFLSRVFVEDNTRNANAIIVQALEPQVDPTTISLLLDIDAFREVALPPEDVSLPDIFEQLRRLKNDVFFASITERTAEMYE